MALYALRSLQVYEEPNGQFAVDHSGTPADFLPVPAQQDSITFDPTGAFLPTNVVQQVKHAKSPRVLGPRAVTLGFNIPIHGSGLAGNASVANADASTNALMRILKATMGGIWGGKLGSTVAAAPTSGSVFSVGAGHGVRFTAGGAMGRINAAGKMEVRPIESVTTDAIVLKYGFSATPTAGDVLFNATTLYLDDSGTHLQFIARGAAPTDRYLLQGLQLAGLSINKPLGELSTFGFTFQGAEWTKLLAGSLEPMAYTAVNYIGFSGGGLMAQPVGTATAAVIQAPEVTITPNVTYVARQGDGGVNTIFGYEQDHAPPVASGSFRPFYESDTWIDAWLNQTPYACALQIGGAQSRACLVECANIEIGPVSGPQNMNKFTGQTVNFEAGVDTDATDQSTAIRRSPLRLHFVG